MPTCDCGSTGPTSFHNPNNQNSITPIIPKTYSLSQNYPNPFNPTTTIEFAIPKDGFVTLKIYDMLGREVSTLVNEFKKAGYYHANVEASNLASGIYFYRISSRDFNAVKKMVLVK